MPDDTITPRSASPSVFKKGHPYYPPKTGQPPGQSALQYKMRQDAALAVRGVVSAEELAQFLHKVMMGVDPRAVPDANGMVHHPPIAMIDSLRAAKMLWERGWGLPAQFMVVKADVEQTVRSDQATADVPRMASDDLLAMREILARAVPADRAMATSALPAKRLGAGGSRGGGDGMGSSGGRTAADGQDDEQDDAAEVENP